MDIWDWLDPWWAWWAGFTGLFDWDALAAIGTVGVLWIAVHEAQSGSRLARMQAEARLERFLEIVTTEWLSIRFRVLEAPDKGAAARQAIAEMDERDPFAALETFSVNDFPSPQSALAFTRTPAVLKALRKSLIRAGNGVPIAIQMLEREADWLSRQTDQVRIDLQRIRTPKLRFLWYRLLKRPDPRMLVTDPLHEPSERDHAAVP